MEIEKKEILLMDGADEHGNVRVKKITRYTMPDGEVVEKIWRTTINAVAAVGTEYPDLAKLAAVVVTPELIAAHEAARADESAKKAAEKAEAEKEIADARTAFDAEKAAAQDALNVQFAQLQAAIDAHNEAVKISQQEAHDAHAAIDADRAALTASMEQFKAEREEFEKSKSAKDGDINEKIRAQIDLIMREKSVP